MDFNQVVLKEHLLLEKKKHSLYQKLYLEKQIDIESILLVEYNYIIIIFIKINYKIKKYFIIILFRFK